MMRHILPAAILALSLALGGCAEKWAKPGAGEQDFRAMEAQCLAYANERWPPMLRETMVNPGYFSPPFRQCDSRGRCAFVGGYFVPPQYAVVDDNSSPRRQERRACFFANGWTPVED